MRAHTKSSNMRSKRGAAGAAAALIAVLLISVNVVPSAAQQAPPPIGTEFLTGRAVFTADVGLKLKNTLDGEATEVAKAKTASRTVVARITVQPGARFPWHTHPGPVVANVAQGELTYVGADDCVEREYPAGTAFVDAGGDHVHTAVNRTDGPTVVVATFFDAPEQGPLTIPVDAPADCQI